VTAAGIFLTHQESPRIRGHFDRLVEETGPLITWHFVLSRDPYPRPDAPFAYPDPAEVLPARYRAMAEHGGVQGGYLDTLLIPVLRGLEGDHLWVCEYDVDYAGRWGELFTAVAGSRADVLTTTLMYRHEQPKWPWWRSAAAPPDVSAESWVRSLNPLLRLTPTALDAYVAAMADPRWRGHYEFTLPTAAREAGLLLEDLGGEGSFVPPGRERSAYVGKSPRGRPPDLTFGFRPARHDYFHEKPDSFPQTGLLYHPVKPGVPTWTRETMNAPPTSASEDLLSG
jgi:hypothetical protein